MGDGHADQQHAVSIHRGRGGGGQRVVVIVVVGARNDLRQPRRPAAQLEHGRCLRRRRQPREVTDRAARLDRIGQQVTETRHAAPDPVAEHPHLAQRRSRVADLFGHRDGVDAAEVGGDQPAGRLGVAREVADLRMAVRGQAGDRNRSDLQTGDVGDDELEDVGKLEDHACTGVQASRGQVQGQAIDEPAERPVGQPPRAVDHGHPVAVGGEGGVQRATERRAPPVTAPAVTPGEIVGPGDDTVDQGRARHRPS